MAMARVPTGTAMRPASLDPPPHGPRGMWHVACGPPELKQLKKVPDQSIHAGRGGPRGGGGASRTNRPDWDLQHAWTPVSCWAIPATADIQTLVVVRIVLFASLLLEARKS